MHSLPFAANPSTACPGCWPTRCRTALIDAWLAAQGRSPADFNAVERLCYVGKELEDPSGYTAIEYAYSLMAKDAGLDNDGVPTVRRGRPASFHDAAFRRTEQGDKLHKLSLTALAHLDFKAASAHSYEQAFDAMRRLKLPMSDVEQQFRRSPD